MKNHCCDDDAGCFAPDSDYNYEDVDCDCDCSRCSASADNRESLDESSAGAECAACDDPVGPVKNVRGAMLCARCAQEAGEDRAREDDWETQRDYRADARMDAKRMGEATSGFDRFMDSILIAEGHNRQPTKQEDNPMRRRAQRHQDRPNNKIRYGVK